MKTILTLAIALVTIGGLAACNTVEGAGEDIKAGGKHIENAASNTKAKM